MGQILSKYIRDGGNGYLMHWCPGCKALHMYMVNSKIPNQNWSYNGNHEKPSFSPSMLINQGQKGKTCHYFLTDGMLAFCSDTDAHGLGGQVVPLPPLPKWMLEGGEYHHSQEDYEDAKFYEALSAEDKHLLDEYMRNHWGDCTTYKDCLEKARKELDGWMDSTMQGGG